MPNQFDEIRCPKCGSTLFKKAGKKGKLYCAKEGCGYETDSVKESGEKDGGDES